MFRIKRRNVKSRKWKISLAKRGSGRRPYPEIKNLVEKDECFIALLMFGCLKKWLILSGKVNNKVTTNLI